MSVLRVLRRACEEVRGESTVQKNNEGGRVSEQERAGIQEKEKRYIKASKC